MKQNDKMTRASVTKKLVGLLFRNNAIKLYLHESLTL